MIPKFTSPGKLAMFPVPDIILLLSSCFLWPIRELFVSTKMCVPPLQPYIFIPYWSL